MPKQVTLYTTRSCPHCWHAKDMLQRKNITFKEIDLTDDDAKREEVEKKTGWMTVPMIFIGDELIGGADELAALEAAGKLDEYVR